MNLDMRDFGSVLMMVLLPAMRAMMAMVMTMMMLLRRLPVSLLS